MKKTILLLLLIGFAGSVKAQELGLRFGNVAFNNVAVDAVIGSGPRIHADVSFGGDGVGVEALWDIIDKQLGSEAGLSWYLGVGGTALLANPFWLGVSGEIGIEYHFKDAPIALGLDWRPTFFFIDDAQFWARGFGFNARYVFQ